MRFLRFALVALSLAASTAFASPQDPKAGIDYTVITPAQPTQASGKKVEVVEFFMYHCPHCNALEPTLAAWVKKEGDNIVFRRYHFAANPLDAQAHLYVTLETMGRLDLHDKVFHAIHVEKNRLNTDELVIDWIGKNGVDKAKFLEFWNSFGVMTKMKRLGQIANEYKVETAPTLVVDGRFLTGPAMMMSNGANRDEALAQRQTLDTLTALVAKAQQEHGAGKGAKK